MRQNTAVSRVAGPWVLALLAVSTGSGVSAQTEDPLAGLAELAESVRAEWRAPGLAVAVVHDGSVVFARGFGLRDVENDLPVTPETVFPIGSATKPFTATSVALLVDDGKLDLDEPLLDRVPDFRLFEDYATLHTTARDLLCHRTGLPGVYDLVWLTTPMSRAELLGRLRHMQANAGFRERFQYSNLGFTAAGVVVERISGMGWEDFVRQRIFEPLGMERTGFTVPENPSAEGWALPYRVVRGEVVPVAFRGGVAFDNVSAIGPAGSIASTVEDLARWVLLHLEGGTFQGKRLVSERMLTEMHSPQQVIRDPGYRALTQAELYGLGWFVSDHRGHRVIHHGGNIEGFSAVVSLMPDLDAGVVVLSNSMNLLGYAISRNVYDRLLGLEPRDWNTSLRELYSMIEQAFEAAAAPPISDPEAPPTRPLAAYAGSYVHPVFGSVEVTPQTAPAGDGLVLEFKSGIRAELHHARFDTFKGPTSELYLPVIETRFHLGDEGGIDRVTMVLQPGAEGLPFVREEDGD